MDIASFWTGFGVACAMFGIAWLAKVTAPMESRRYTARRPGGGYQPIDDGRGPGTPPGPE